MPEQGSHFWFMTIQSSSADGRSTIVSCRGAITPARDATRLDLFDQLRAEVWEREPESRGGVVLAFDVQPNQL